MRELLSHIQYEGFDVYAYAEPEQEDYIDVFEKDDESIAIQKRINNGDLICFIVFIEVYKHGIKLGTSCIGMNVYEDIHDFVKDSLSFNDIVNEAIEEAKENIKLLTNEG